MCNNRCCYLSLGIKLAPQRGREEGACACSTHGKTWLGERGNIFLLLCNKQFVGVNRSWGWWVVSGFRPLLNILEICHPCWWKVPFLLCACGLYAQPRSNIKLERECVWEREGGPCIEQGPGTERSQCLGALLNLCMVLKTGWNLMLTSVYGPEEVKCFLKGLRFKHFLGYDATVIWASLVSSDFGGV